MIFNEFVDYYKPKLMEFLESEGRELLVNAGVQVGKTYTSLVIPAKMGYNGLYYSDRHEQMKQKEGELKNLGFKVMRVQGRRLTCECKDDPIVSKIIKFQGNACLVCPKYQTKEEQKTCAYHKQFKYDDYQVFMAPKEYSNHPFFQKNSWKFVVWDEEIEVGRKIEAYINAKPSVIKKHLGPNSVDDFKFVRKLVEEEEDLDVRTLEGMDKLIELDGIVEKIKSWGSALEITRDNLNDDIMDLLKFITNIQTTHEWIETKYVWGEKRVYFKQRFNDLYNDEWVLKENFENLILLNASLKEEYLQIFGLNNFRIVSYPQIQEESTLIVYWDKRGRSFNKLNIFDVKDRKLVFKNYGKEEFENIQALALALQKRDYKVGLISFKQFIEDSEEDFIMFDKIGYFRGTTGMANWNDIDVLFVFGTFTRGDYNEPYETLFHDHEDHEDQEKKGKGVIKRVHNSKLWFPSQHEQYITTQYCRDQDMEQVICRSGLFNTKGKVVIVLGYCPFDLTENCNVRYIGGGKVDGLKTKTSDTKNMLRLLLNTLKHKAT